MEYLAESRLRLPELIAALTLGIDLGPVPVAELE
jgi:hypothetical protein